MHGNRCLTRPAVACLLGCLALAGCGKQIWVTRYPSFYSPELKTIAVAPLANTTSDPAAGRVMAEKVARALTACGTYHLLGPGDLPAPADPQAGRDAGALVQALRKQGKIQAVLTGTVTAYGALQESHRKQRPVYGEGDKDKRRISHYERYTSFRNEATVDATIRLIRVSDGAVLHATRPGAAAVKVVSSSDDGGGTISPEMDRQTCLAAAADQCTAKLLEEFAVVRQRVRVGRGAFRTAAELRDMKWRGGKKFRMTDAKMFVVVSLPPSCDRNTFRIAIARGGGGQEVAGLELAWLGHWSGKTGKGFEFTPGEIAARGGTGDYVARLYCGREPVLETAFKIVPK